MSGLLIILVGGLVAIAKPASAELAYRRWSREHALAAELRAAFPIAPADDELDALLERLR